MTGVLIKKGNWDTEMRLIKGKQREENREKLSISSQGEGPETDPSLTGLQGTRLADTLIMDFDSLLQDNKFLLLKAPILSQWPWKTTIWY